ncbi:MAG: PadR family transcriptional regulator [Dietzia psychralcaliphila]
MSLKFAILTSLTERAGSGIELARRFDKSIGYFWPATHQQIYRELDRLGESGLIRELPLVGAPSRGNPRRFEVTEDGRTLLTEWICEPDEPDPMRSTMAVRVRAAAATGAVHEVREALMHHRDQRAANLGRYREIEDRDFARTGPGDARDLLQHRVLRLGIEVEQAWVSWCDEVLEMLDRLPAG